MTSSAIEAERERRAARRAALRAAHPDLGGDAQAFIAVLRAFDESRAPRAGRSGTAPDRTTGLAGGAGAAPATGPGAHSVRPVVTSTVRSRAARRARRVRRRLRDAAARAPLGRPVTRYAEVRQTPPGSTSPYLSEERA